MHEYIVLFYCQLIFPDSSRYATDPEHSNTVVQTPPVHMVRNPQRTAPSLRGPASTATLMKMSWFWTTAEPDKAFNAQGDERNPPAVISQEQTTSQSTSRNRNTAGKSIAVDMCACVVTTKKQINKNNKGVNGYSQ